MDDDLFDRLHILFAKISYTIGGGLVVNGFMPYLNNNAPAFGVIFGFMSICLQAYFGMKRAKK